MKMTKKELDKKVSNQNKRLSSSDVVRPYRQDGYVNLMNKYGTKQDNAEQYRFEREAIIPDQQLTSLYEGNGLFAKIIDAPAEEALKHGFDLGLNNPDLDTFTEDALDDLEWEEKAATAIKWSRLYGGAIIVMLIDDGRGLEEPVDWKHIRSIDELRVYERPLIQPDYASLYKQDFGLRGEPSKTSKFGQPEYYYVSSIYGSFTVHESRCMVFKNGVLPEQLMNANYRIWGMPEYIRIRRALRECTTAHTDATKLLERSVQPIYSMKNLAQMLATDNGENSVLKRLQIIDEARGFLNSIAIDADGEQYDFKSATYTGVRDVIDATCNMLSALTNIPQTILFGRSPAGMNATGTSDLENWYSYVERIQKLMLKRNLRNLIDIIFKAGLKSKDIEEIPDYKLTFNPLWSLSDTEQAAVDAQKASTAQVKAQTAQIYVDMQALDPSEVRRSLAKDEDFDVEDIITEEDGNPFDDVLNGESEQSQNPMEQTEEQQSQQQVSDYKPKIFEQGDFKQYAKDSADTKIGVGVIVIKGNSILCGNRKESGQLCGPGGHIEQGETPKQAAIRETKEEFGITPKDLTYIGYLPDLKAPYCPSHIFVCTDWEDDVNCDEVEMEAPKFYSLTALTESAEKQPDYLFKPFAKSLKELCHKLFGENYHLYSSENEGIIKSDEGNERSGNWGHSGRKGKVGGSEKRNGSDIENQKPKFSKVTCKKFHQSISSAKASRPAKDQWRVDVHTEEEYNALECSMITTDQGSTVAVTKNGDIISVCKHKQDKRASGRRIMAEAVANGGVKLDSFKGNHKFYVSCGFEPVSWTPFNKQYAPEGWVKSGCEEVEVVFYKYVGKGKVRYKDINDFIANVPCCVDDGTESGYDKAKEIRDKSLEE